MAMFRTGTPTKTVVINKTENEILVALEKLSFTLKTATEEECQKALSALLKRHIDQPRVREFIAKAKEN